MVSCFFQSAHTHTLLFLFPANHSRLTRGYHFRWYSSRSETKNGPETQFRCKWKYICRRSHDIHTNGAFVLLFGRWKDRITPINTPRQKCNIPHAYFLLSGCFCLCGILDSLYSLSPFFRILFVLKSYHYAKSWKTTCWSTCSGWELWGKMHVLL